jgi:FtsZ-binding cell division protein ZapB
MNIQKILADLEALQQEVDELKCSNNTLQDKVSSIDARFDSLIVCEAPPQKKQKVEPKLQVQHLLNDPPPPPFTDWVSQGHSAIASATYLADTTRAQATKEWTRAVDAIKDNPDIPQLWTHLRAYCKSVPNENSRCTKMGQIKSVFKAMQMEYDHDFNIEHDMLRNLLTYEKEYRQLTEKELAPYKCTDGTYITLTKLQDVCNNKDINAFDRMQLAFSAYHGNRDQDWQIRYKKENADKHGYYDPETKQMHVTGRKTDAIKEGKTITGYKTRVFTVHPVVAECIAEFHKDKTHVWLMPQEKDSTKCCVSRNKNIQRRFFKTDKYGFPKDINLTEIRHLYETHVRYVKPLPEEELKATMLAIGHSNTTAVKHYSEMFRLMHQSK